MAEQVETTNELVADFVDEAMESLNPLADFLTDHRNNPSDPGPINAAFRAVHSIKGCAGFMGFTAIKLFTHSVENTMDDVRNGKTELTEDLQRGMVLGFDVMQEMLQEALSGETKTELNAEQESLLAEIGEAAGSLEFAKEDELIDGINAVVEAMVDSDLSGAENWAAKLESLIGNYKENGEEGGEEAAESKGPTPSELREKTFKVGDADTTEQVTQILEVFWAMDENNYSDDLGKECASKMLSFATWAESAGNADLTAALKKGEANLTTLISSPLDMDAGLLEVVWDDIRDEFIKLLPVEAIEEEKSEESAEASSEKAPAAKAARMLRVKEESVDEFLDDVAGLFITAELLKDLQSRMSQQGSMRELVEELRQVNDAFQMQSNQLQQSVVELRKIAISGLFSKFPRMARQLATQLGKKIDVHISGEALEIDKSLVENLDAPLTHMVRNVVDHALEMPEDREDSGKTESGNMWLTAELTATHVIISVRDDGRGIDPNMLRRKAVEKGLKTEAEVNAMDDEEALQLILEAGFSTADKVTEVSGRGVGMDVVRSNLAEYQGEIFLESRIGVGSAVRLEIPIRKAVLVIDGLMVQQGSDQFVVPFDHIVEITELTMSDFTFVHGKKVATIRDINYEAISLSEILSIPSNHEDADRRMQAVVVNSKHGQLCLLVDAIHGHRQVVLNSVDTILPDAKKIGGVAQLGGGRLALSLNIEEIVLGLHTERKMLAKV